MRIETEDGLVGWGEGKNAAGSAGNYGALVTLINQEIGAATHRPRSARHRPIWEKPLFRLALSPRRGARPRHAGACARRGITVAAISAIDIALWDISGKHRRRAGVAAARRPQGGPLPAYASGGWADADGIGAQLQSYIDAGGFKAVKMRVGAMDGAAHVSADAGEGGARGAWARTSN